MTAGIIGNQLAQAPAPSGGGSSAPAQRGSSTPPASSAAAGAAAPQAASAKGSLVVLPAGFFGDLLSNFSGAIGGAIGGAFGNQQLGQQIGNAASPLVKLLPFTVIPPSVAPQSAGPDGARGSDQSLVVVPAGFLGGLLGGIGGNLLGGTIGNWLGNKQAGQTVGSTVGGILGGLLPFQVLPPAVTPQSTGPDGTVKQDPMIVVPAGFFGHLLSGVASTIASYSSDSTVQTIASGASSLANLLPFQEVPPEMVPQATGPDGATAPAERMIVVPAGFFGNLLSGLSETVGGVIGGAFGNQQMGQQIGSAASPLLKLLPFSMVPPELQPQAAGPDGGQPQQELMVVPAGFFGNLLSSFSGAIGGAIGGAFGNQQLGQNIGTAASPLLKLLPFSVLPPGTEVAPPKTADAPAK